MQLAISHDTPHINIPKNIGKNRLELALYNGGYRNPAATDPNLETLIFNPIAKESYFPKNHFETNVDYATLRFSPPKEKINLPNSINI